MGVTVFCGDMSASIGGMQTHCHNITKYLEQNKLLDYVIYRFPTPGGYDCNLDREVVFASEQEMFDHIRRSSTLYFNDGWWIERWTTIRNALSDKLFVFRTGGNEFVKAPYTNNDIPLKERQLMWRNQINACMDIVISNSRYTTNRLLCQGIDLRKIVTIRGGVDLVECKNNYLNRLQLRNEFDLKFNTKGKCVFSIVSRFEPFKGIIDILEIFAESRENDNYFLLIVGGGSEKERIEMFCSDLLSPNQYCILQETNNSEAMKYIALSNYYINCSHLFQKQSGDETYIHTETMGRSLLEAIYQYVPVIATNVGGTAELFDEFEEIGILLPDDKSHKAKAIQKILNNEMDYVSQGIRYEQYGWDYINDKLYKSLFQNGKNLLKKKSAICFDIDGTIYHQILSEQQNKDNLEAILQMSELSEIIIDSAADYEEIIDRYPLFDVYKYQITIITNCGKHLYINGVEDEFWRNYMESIPGIQQHIVKWVHDKLIEKGIHIISQKTIDKLYVNFKTDSLIKGLYIDEINDYLNDSEYMVVSNKSNIKIISKIVNKGAPIAYLMALNNDIDYWIGAGNNVLDFSFLDMCDLSYTINCESEIYENISIKCNKDMLCFITLLKKKIEGQLKKYETL